MSTHDSKTSLGVFNLIASALGLCACFIGLFFFTKFLQTKEPGDFIAFLINIIVGFLAYFRSPTSLVISGSGLRVVFLLQHSRYFNWDDVLNFSLSTRWYAGRYILRTNKTYFVISQQGITHFEKLKQSVNQHLNQQATSVSNNPS